MLWCMAIFWRSLDWRSHKKPGEQETEDKSEEEFKTEYDFNHYHRAWMSTAQDAAADSMLYLSHLEWTEVADEGTTEDGACD